jgi:ubiquitin carboxyl-terminal hydrolase 5/13
VNVRLVKK